jgi:hypothetical protein
MLEDNTDDLIKEAKEFESFIQHQMSIIMWLVCWCFCLRCDNNLNVSSFKSHSVKMMCEHVMKIVASCEFYFVLSTWLLTVFICFVRNWCWMWGHGVRYRNLTAELWDCWIIL